MKRLPLLLTLMLGLVAFGLMSCEKQVEKIVEAPPAIQVTSINYAQADTTITQGKTVMFVASVEAEDTVDVGSLQFKWFADKGSFKTSSGDTATWVAPGEDGVAKLSVHVTDGSNIAIGSRNVGVNVYTPTADVYYVGVNECSQCHNGGTGGQQYEPWTKTAHADAWATLEASDHAASYCEPCHTVNQNDTPGNSGFDEVPTAKFEDVQCESCHGPGSAHAGGTEASPPNGPLAALDAATCATCHEGAHHPYFDEWETSMHAKMDENHAYDLAYCQPCHSGAGFVAAYDQNESSLFTDAGSDPGNLTCGACHDSHDATNPGQLRTVAAVTLVENDGQTDGGGMTVEGHGAGQLCMQCHHARHAPVNAEGDEIAEGDAHFGPHHSTQADVLYGQTGYELVNASFTFNSSGHGEIEDACVTCHVHAVPYGEFAADSASVGHTFLPTTAACEPCHGEINDFSDIMAKHDYDNDGTVEGIQVEVGGLMEMLATKMVEADTTPGDTLVGAVADVDSVLDHLDGMDATSALAVELRKAGWNLSYVANDASHGVHNPAYVIELLQQSINFLDPGTLPQKALFRDNRATTLPVLAFTAK